MAHYIGPDGRLISFDAEVKADGSIRPKNYGEFINETISLEQIPQTPQPVQRKLSTVNTYNGKYERTFLTKSKKKAIRIEISKKIGSFGFNSWIQIRLNQLYQSLYVVQLDKSSLNAFKPYIKNLSRIEDAIFQLNTFLINRIYKCIELKVQKTKQQPANLSKPTISLSENVYVDRLNDKEYKKAFIKIKAFLDQRVASEMIPSKVHEFICIRYNELHSAITSTDYIDTRIKGTRFENYRSTIFQLIKQCNQIITNNCSNNKSKNQSNNSSSLQVQKTKTPGYQSVIRPIRESDQPFEQKKASIYDNSNVLRHANPARFGYARDFFGRIQERDSYREDRPVNPYHSRSNYDREDDNDSLDLLD